MHNYPKVAIDLGRFKNHNFLKCKLFILSARIGKQIKQLSLVGITTQY